MGTNVGTCVIRVTRVRTSWHTLRKKRCCSAQYPPTESMSMMPAAAMNRGRKLDPPPAGCSQRRTSLRLVLSLVEDLVGHTRASENVAMSERSGAQLGVIKTVTNVLRAVDISAWLFGGWGLDARIGRVTRDHGDIEFWVERADADRSREVLTRAGATALATQPPEEACEFIWDGVEFSTAYFDRQPDGSFSQPQGRWSDWLFPPGSFDEEPVMLDGTQVLAMSISGMLAMKVQFPGLRNGRPWRQKDIDDIETLRGLATLADAPS